MASAVVGVRIDSEHERFKMRQVHESCQHPERGGNKFCPVCGTKVETRTTVVDTAEDVMKVIEGRMPSGYVAMEGSGIVGFARSANMYNVPGMPETSVVRDVIRKAVESYVPWDELEPTFGLHIDLEGY